MVMLITFSLIVPPVFSVTRWPWQSHKHLQDTFEFRDKRQNVFPECSEAEKNLLAEDLIDAPSSVTQKEIQLDSPHSAVG